jgi:putative peptidoglycan lipid II flippase
MTALTVLSRATGLARNVVVVAVLGVTFLGNTYQSANMVPNLLFELLAAGVLQAVLIPTLVELAERGRDDEAEHVARSVLGLAGAGLAVLAAVGIVAAPWVMRVLVSGVDDPATREAQVRLGTILLWFFLPQVVLYAANMVATGVLNAKGRFGVPVFAPVLNNLVVIGSYGLFWLLRDGAAPSLDLTGAQQAVLGLGTTLGVVAFCLLPFVAAVRSGTSLRPRFDHRHPEVRRIARRGGWAAMFLASTQVLLGVVLVLANHVEGGVVAWQLGFTVFLLPHALVSLPVLTALFPTLSRQAVAGDETAYGQTVAAGLRAIVFLVLPGTAAMLALGLPLARALQFGEFAGGGVGQVAGAVAAFGPGLAGYGAFLFLARALYASGDTRTPALVNMGVVAGGGLAMVVAFNLVSGDGRVAALAAAHSATYLAGAALLFFVVRSRSSTAGFRVGRSVAAGAFATGLAASVMWWTGRALATDGRPGALVELLVGGAAGLVTYLAASAVLGGPRPSAVPALLRGGHA